MMCSNSFLLRCKYHLNNIWHTVTSLNWAIIHSGKENRGWRIARIRLAITFFEPWRKDWWEDRRNLKKVQEFEKKMDFKKQSLLDKVK